MSSGLRDYICGGNFIVGHGGRTVAVNEGIGESLYANIIQWVREPLSMKNRFYQVKLLTDLDSEAGQYCMLGTNVAAKRSHAVWDMHGSIRYRSLEGGVFTGGTGLHSDKPFGQKGDKILVYLEQSYEDKSLINFFLNGTLIYRQWVKVTPDNLYPAVGVDRGPAKFLITWPGMLMEIPLDIQRVHKTLSSWLGFRNFTKDDSTNILTLSGLDNSPRDGFNAQAPRSLSPDGSTYFEIELMSSIDSTSGPSIGLTPGFTSKFKSPGQETMTIGYHAYSGEIYNESEDCTVTSGEDGRRCVVGDRVGCGLVFTDRTDSQYCTESMVLVYFTKNGQIVYTKPRFMPREGFYPTIGMTAVGEHVKVLSSCVPPDIPASVDDIISKWQPLYTNFRFTEVINFLDYDQHGTANKIHVKDSNHLPCIVQHLKEYGENCCYRVTIESIDEDSEIQLGAAGRTIATQTETLRNSATRPVLCLSRNHPNSLHIKAGDRVDVFMETTNRGHTLLLFLIENRLVQRNHIESRRNIPEKLCPTICVKGGAITLDVAWPDNDILIDVVPDLVSTNLSYWMYPSCISISDKLITCNSIEDDSLAYNVIAPYPLTQEGVFYFQMTYVLKDTPCKPVFPGIGITKCSVHTKQKLHLMLNDMWTVLYYASSQKLVTWKGSKVAEHEDGTEKSTYYTVGCSAAYDNVKNAFQLRFYCDMNLEVTAEIEAPGPAAGYYPAFSFQKGTQGQTFNTDLTQTDKQQFHLPLAHMNPGPERLYHWRDEDRLHLAPFDDTASVTSDDVKERQSLVNNLYVCHCLSDNTGAQTITHGLQQKGYAVQTSLWNTGSDRMLNLEMAQVVILCLSTSAIKDQALKKEFNFAVCKNLPLLPVLLQSIAWPPSCLDQTDTASIERFTDVKLDFSQSKIDGKDLVLIERNLQGAISVSLEPVELGPVPGNQNIDLDSEEETERKILPRAIYKSYDTIKKGSRACTVL